MPLDIEKRRQIEQIFRKFLLNRIKTVRRLKMTDLDINPFLIRILSHELGLDNSEAIVRWLISQRLERGTVTSFGIALQDAAKVFSEGTGVEGADILKTKKGRHHHIQVKSGPNTIPKDLGVRIAQLLRSAQRRNRGSLALYGMCYGSNARVSSIVRKYVEEEGGVDWISGKEFWEFISDDPQCLEEIYEIAADIGRTFKDGSGQSLSEVIEAKIQELTKGFEENYGKGGSSMWKKLLEDNS
ncbi:MAG: PmeII family type II restriction endonuclease [Actinomycetota bacterium]|nr:PmeII family type II restriction endonuclease [Actinomycetota bacterium]